MALMPVRIIKVNMRKQTKSNIYALTAVGFWSTIASASKLTLLHLTPAELVFYSSLVSCCVLFLVLLIQKKLHLIKKSSKQQIVISLLYGLLNPFLYYLVLFEAYDLLPAQQAQAINYTWAITLTLLSIPILGHKVRGVQWLAIGTSYVGVLVIATKGDILSLHFDNPVGVALALLSTILWALYWIFNTKDKRDPEVGLFLNFLTVIPFILVYMLWSDSFHQVNIPGLLGAGYIGAFEMGITFVLWLNGLKLTESSAKTANFIFIAPIISLFLIHFLVGEQIFISTIVGLFFVLCGLGIQAFCSSEKKVRS